MDGQGGRYQDLVLPRAVLRYQAKCLSPGVGQMEPWLYLSLADRLVIIITVIILVL